MTKLDFYKDIRMNLASTCVSIANAIDYMTTEDCDNIYPETVNLVAGLSSSIERIAGIHPAKAIDFKQAANEPSALTIARIKSEYVDTLNRLTVHHFKMLGAYISMQVDHAISLRQEVADRLENPKQVDSNHLNGLQSFEFDDWFNGKFTDEDFERIMFKRYGNTRILVDHFTDSTESEVLRLALEHSKKCLSTGTSASMPYTGMSAGTIKKDTYAFMGGQINVDVAIGGLQTYWACDTNAHRSRKGRARFKTDNKWVRAGGMAKGLKSYIVEKRLDDTLTDIKVNIVPIIGQIVKAIESNGIPYAVWQKYYFVVQPVDRDVALHVDDEMVPTAVTIFSPIYGYMNKLDMIISVLNGIDRMLPIIMDYGRFNVSAQLSSESNSIPPVDSGASS